MMSSDSENPVILGHSDVQYGVGLGMIKGNEESYSAAYILFPSYHDCKEPRTLVW